MTSAPLPSRRHLRQILREVDGWPGSLMRLAGLTVLLTALFHADLGDIVRVWLTSSPYSHCIFLPPIIAWMVWQRRDGLARLAPRDWWPGLVWLGLGAFVWLLGWAAGVALLRHGALVVMAQGLVLATLGPAVGRALIFPLFYAFFLVPVGTEAEPYLQILTARMAINLLWLAGVPAEISGIFITTPNGYFRVAEACSGTGFLIAMAAFSTLVAHLSFKSPLRRGLFVAGALLVCLLANGVRAFAIILIAYHTSVNSAVVVDHVLYGWLFFALVLVLVLLIGWPFYDRSPIEPWFEPARLQGAVEAPRGPRGVVIALAVAILVLPAGWVTASQAFSPDVLPVPRLPEVRGWARVEAGEPPAWAPHFAGADRIRLGHYRDPAGRIVDLAVVGFAWQAEGKELVGFGQGAASPDGQGAWTWAAPARAPVRARGDMLAGPGGERRLAYSFYHVGGRLTGVASRVKIETLKARLLGRDQRALAIILSTPVPDGPDGEAEAARVLAGFIGALGAIEDLADRSLAID
jgi:exosortase A